MKGSPDQTVVAAFAPATDVLFEEFFLAHRQQVFSAVWLLTRDRHEAEEITQEAFVRALERWSQISSLEDPVGYLIKIAINIWRSKARRAVVAVKHVLQPRHQEDAIAISDSQDVVVHALAALTPGQRGAVVLTALLDLTSDEAAKALGVRPSTVRVLAARGRERLRQQMEDS